MQCPAGEVKTLAFANFSKALVAAAPKKGLVAAGGTPSNSASASSGSGYLGYRSIVLDYAKQVCSFSCYQKGSQSLHWAHPCICHCS